MKIFSSESFYFIGCISADKIGVAENRMRNYSKTYN